MELGLEGKVVIVNGASQGIGLAIARMFAQEGSRIVVTARRVERLELARQEVEDVAGGGVVAIQGDIRKAEDCERIVSETLSAHGGVDVLVNNDGAPPLGEALAFDDAAWARAIEQNLMSVIRMARGVVPSMRERGGGRIVNIAALSAIQPLPAFGLSVATWAGVIGFSKTLSLEVAQDGITINTICPGLIDTPRLQKVTSQSGSPMEEQARDIPVGRVGAPDEVAALAVFLASHHAGYLTGLTFPIEGGLRKAVL
jgi:3-oxoacyl-[acyl-carrier protein] reductase